MPTTEQRDVPRPLMPFLYSMERLLLHSKPTVELLMNRGKQGVYGGGVYTAPGGVCAHTPNFYSREIPTKKRVLPYTPNWRRGCHVYGKKFRLFYDYFRGVDTPVKTRSSLCSPESGEGRALPQKKQLFIKDLKRNIKKLSANLLLKIKYPDLKTVMPVSKSGLLCVDEFRIIRDSVPNGEVLFSEYLGIRDQNNFDNGDELWDAGVVVIQVVRASIDELGEKVFLTELSFPALMCGAIKRDAGLNN